MGSVIAYGFLTLIVAMLIAAVFLVGIHIWDDAMTWIGVWIGCSVVIFSVFMFITYTMIIVKAALK